MSGSRTFGPGYNFPGFAEPSSKPILLWDPENPATFLELVDTFNSYAGLAGRVVIVNSTENGLTTSTVSIESDKNYIHVQLTPATTWVINHPLQKLTSVTLVDSSGHEMESDVQHLDDSNVEINFVNAKAGAAYLN